MLQVPVSEDDVETMIRILDNHIRKAKDETSTKTWFQITQHDRELRGRLESALDKARTDDSPL